MLHGAPDRQQAVSKHQGCDGHQGSQGCHVCDDHEYFHACWDCDGCQGVSVAMLSGATRSPTSGRDFHELPVWHRWPWLSHPGVMLGSWCCPRWHLWHLGVTRCSSASHTTGHGVSTPHDMIAPQRGELLKRPPSVSWQGIGIEAQPVVQL
jgi:hypothetical protein